MSLKHIFAVIGIFLLGVMGWVILGSASMFRSMDASSRLDHAVQGLWGSPIVQSAPRFYLNVPGTDRTRSILASANRIEVDLSLEQRRKGLVWYPTFVTDFSGTYEITNPDGVQQNVRLHFPLPAHEATYDRFGVWLDGEREEAEVASAEGIRKIISLAPGQTRTFKVNYSTRGLREWRYRLTNAVANKLAKDGGRVRGLDMQVRTNFSAVDFPEGSLSPEVLEQNDIGSQLRWRADDLLTRQDVAITMPEKINPGPLSARMSFFAPVCLLFFFVLITAIGIFKRITIHPMHYLFVTAGFFAFHLLFAYLVDLINVHVAFGISTVTSVGLVVAYLRAALGPQLPWRLTAVGQLLYLVLFSYSFFLNGATGITIAVGSVITLAVLMAMTARLDWQQVFASRKPSEPVATPAG